MAWWLLALPGLWLFILLLFAGPARAAWREPVLRHAVLIIESDDWGPGPPSHAHALRRLVDCLNAFRDASGRTPAMTLGLTLSLPDSEAIFDRSGAGRWKPDGAPWATASAGVTAHVPDYRARLITDPAYADILAAIKAGIRVGVFAPQLHGMAHYWPDALMAVARHDPAVRAWVSNGPGQETETLPSPLQSRWIDAGMLPSRPLPDVVIQDAVAEEVACYRAVFNATPEVVVPPTFIWTEAVEIAWAAHGVGCIVTPGRRYTSRDAAGQPVPEQPSRQRAIQNGQHGAGGMIYLVRDRYFEPALGHKAERALAALAEKTAQGRPCLLETHRFNFTGAGQDAALEELRRLLQSSLARYPEVCFTSTAELAEQYRMGGNWLSSSLSDRLAAWTARMVEVPRFVKLARLTGFGMLMSLFNLISSRTAA